MMFRKRKQYQYITVNNEMLIDDKKAEQVKKKKKSQEYYVDYHGRIISSI